MEQKGLDQVEIIDFSKMKKTDKKQDAKTRKQKAKQESEKQVKEEQVEEKKVDIPVIEQKVEKQEELKKEEKEHQKVEVPEQGFFNNKIEFKDPFTYQKLLERIIDLLSGQIKETNQKFQVQPPQIAKIQGKRTQCTNFVDICKQLQRNPEHLCEFFLTELGASGVVAENSLILKGYFYIKSFESILSKYYNEYVKCPSCLNGNTELEKDQQTRSHKLTCNNCKSTKYVKDIESGYQALKKGQRRKDRMK